MTLAEKCIEIGENNEAIAAKPPKVYAAGKNSMVDESKLLPTTVSGNYISVDDVSEVPHEVKCKISGIDNPSDVKITRCGRNLLNPNNLGGGELIVFNGTLCYKYRDKGNNPAYTDGLSIEGCFKKNMQYSFTIRQSREASNSHKIWQIYALYTDGTESTTGQISTEKTHTFTTLNGKTVKKIYAAYYSGTFIYLDLSVSCLYEGATVLPYEPYNGQTLTPVADGTVDGITSVSPYMNIFTDTEGVNIEATYNKNWSMQEVQQRFCDVFKQETISHSLSFERLTLSKESIKSIITALSSSVIDQTVTFKNSAKEAAFTDEEWAELIATKPNWTFFLV